jgi:hypothetical protein
MYLLVPSIAAALGLGLELGLEFGLGKKRMETTRRDGKSQDPRIKSKLGPEH